MGIMRGLKEMEAGIPGEAPKYDGPKVKWMKLDNGQSVNARFMNELSEDSPNYNPKFDLAVVIKEHTSPTDYTRKAECTMDEEGRCFACEMYAKQGKGSGWHIKYRYYTNILVNDGIEDPYVAVWSQGTSKQSAFDTIKDFAIEYGSITNRQWKITRKGSGTDTRYTLLSRDPDTEPFDWNGYEPFDLTHIVRTVPYSEQEGFYLGFDDARPKTSTNIEWE